MNGYLKKEAIGLDGFGQKTLSAWNSRRCSIDRSMMLQNLTLVITLLYHSLRAHQPGADAVLIARACSFGNREDSRRVAIIVFVWMLPGPSTQALSSPCQNVMRHSWGRSASTALARALQAARRGRTSIG